jgi:hypothetical protein
VPIAIQQAISIEHLLEIKKIGATEVCLELKKHHAHTIKLLGEQVLPAIR